MLNTEKPTSSLTLETCSYSMRSATTYLQIIFKCTNHTQVEVTVRYITQSNICTVYCRYLFFLMFSISHMLGSKDTCYSSAHVLRVCLCVVLL